MRIGASRLCFSVAWLKTTVAPCSTNGGREGVRPVNEIADHARRQTQILSEIVGENVWFRANFNQFSSTATKLPFDHKFRERGLSAYSRQGNFASRGVKRSAIPRLSPRS